MRWRIAALYGLMLGMIAMAGSPQEGTGSDGFSRAGSKHQRAYALPKSIEDLNNSLPGEYLIGPGDLLDIQVWEQENLSGEQTVGPDGMISLPFAGFVQVEGKTRAQARELVQDRVLKARQEVARLARVRYEGGESALTEVLEAELEVLGARADRLQSQREALLALVGVYKTMGGGWMQERDSRQAAAGNVEAQR